MSVLFNIGTKILSSNIYVPENTQYAPIDGNEFEWKGLTYKVIVIEYADGSKLAWLDRNLGASQAATSRTDAQAYGDLYQWGRRMDGHEKRTSGTRNEQSSTPQPSHSDFIIGYSNWLNPSNNNLWQGVNGINNPSPPGWRVPTIEELIKEKDSWDENNYNGAFNSVLKFPSSGIRPSNNGALVAQGTRGDLWSSSPTESGNQSQWLTFTENSSRPDQFGRAIGFSIRCVRSIQTP